MALWPGSLGVPLVSGFTAESMPRIAETTMSSGPKRRVMMSSHDTTTGSVTFAWDAAQKLVFDTLFNVTLRKGTLPIDDFPLDIVDGVAAHRAWISAPSQVTSTPDDLWKVTFKYETDERNQT